MKTILLEPEFFIDYNGSISDGPILIKNKNSKSKNSTQIDKINLKNKVVMPAFVNCHSHAFQRLLRGVVEKKTNRDSTFWTWRNYMYKLANKINLTMLENIATFLYLEMIESGIAFVGEFHYLHHDILGKRYADPLAPSKALINAAKKANINLCLMQCAFHEPDFRAKVNQHSNRFQFRDIEEFKELIKLSLHNNKSIKNLIAMHSIRTVPKKWMKDILDLKQKFDLPLHIHACEQKDEVKYCLETNGQTPIELLSAYDLIDKQTTLVHATHLSDNDFEIIKKFRPHICLCPSTEKNLGDGVIHLEPLIKENIKICLGSDQHVRLDFFGEARSLEEQERLRLCKRNILNKKNQRLYEAIFPIMHKNGITSLYGNTADITMNNNSFIAVDLPPEYEWHGPHVALEAILLSSTPANVSFVINNGQISKKDNQTTCKDKAYLKKEIQQFLHKQDLHY